MKLLKYSWLIVVLLMVGFTPNLNDEKHSTIHIETSTAVAQKAVATFEVPVYDEFATAKINVQSPVNINRIQITATTIDKKALVYISEYIFIDGKLHHNDGSQLALDYQSENDAVKQIQATVALLDNQALKYEVVVALENGDVNTQSFLAYVDNNAPQISSGQVLAYNRQKVDLPIRITGSAIKESAIDVSVNKNGQEYAIVPIWTTKQSDLYEGKLIMNEDGLYDITVTAKDYLNREVTREKRFVIDTKKPNVLFPKSQQVFQKVDSFPIRVTDLNLDKVAVTVFRNNVLWWQNSMQLDNETEFVEYLSMIEEGKYTISVSSVDKAGNEDVQQSSVIIDSSAPTISYLGVNPDQLLTESSAITVSIRDLFINHAKATVVQQTQSGTVSFELALKQIDTWMLQGVFEATQEGIYSVNIYASDMLNNTAISELSFSLIQNELVRHINKQPDRYEKVVSVPIDISWDGLVPLKQPTVTIFKNGYVHFIDQSKIEFVTTPFNKTLRMSQDLFIEDGVYIVVIEGVDYLMRPIKYRHVFQIDTVPPMLEDYFLEDNEAISQLHYTLSDESGIGQIEIYSNGSLVWLEQGEYKKIVQGIVPLVKLDGEVTLRVIDRLGNVFETTWNMMTRAGQVDDVKNVIYEDDTEQTPVVGVAHKIIDDTALPAEKEYGIPVVLVICLLGGVAIGYFFYRKIQ